MEQTIQQLYDRMRKLGPVNIRLTFNDGTIKRRP